MKSVAKDIRPLKCEIKIRSSNKVLTLLTTVHLCAVPPPEERNKLWMVEADISPEMMKRKKKKKKRKKEVRSVAPVEEGVNPRHREFGASAVPRLPKLPAHRSLVANLWERQRQQEENVLPGSFPEFRPSCPIPYQERYGGLGYVSSNQPSRELGCNLSNPLTLSQYEGRGQLKQPAWQSNGHNGVFRYSGHEMPSSVGGGRTGFTAPRSEGRKPVTAPIHSRTNLMEAELMDADSDF